MLRVSNKSCIRGLSRKCFGAARARNIVAVLAIALTTVLFTSLFTVGLSMNEAFQQSNFRQVGGCSHGGFKYLTHEQFLELREDPLIRQWGVSRVLGMGRGDALRKNHVELRWADATLAHWYFLDPIKGRLPKEGTREAAADLELLSLLGVEPELGAEFTMEVDVCGKKTQETFTLCGWWEKDPIVVANHVLIPESRVDQVLKEQGITLPAEDRITGGWNLDVMFKNANHIEENLKTILANHGYQSEDPARPDHISIGVNWAYTGAQYAQNADAGTVLALAGLVLLIMFTGYLIIYNVFQISVVNDIRFYGLLKTIGTTGRQVKSILRRQALFLCLAGVPLGCGIGWLLGAKLTPVILSRLNGLSAGTVSASPLIFAGSAVFAVFTVLLSCARPARMAARVSPVEAVRCTEGAGKTKKKKKRSRRFSVWQMAAANLGRSKGKTFVTILSLTLALVLLQMTVVFTNGFDMDKYLQDAAAVDFILADGAYFDNNVYGWGSGENVLSEEDIAPFAAHPDFARGGRVYGQLDAIQEFVPPEWYKKQLLRWNESEQSIQLKMENQPRTPDGRIMDRVNTYGMEPYILDQLTLLEGDLSELYQPGSRAVAAVCSADDYGKLKPSSHWAKLGDTVTLRVPEKWEYFDPETGEVSEDPDTFEGRTCLARPIVYKDEIFTVKALVLVPSTLCYRYYGSDEFVLNAQTLKQIAPQTDVMLYAFDVKEGSLERMEACIRDYTEKTNPRCGYESKQSYVAEFESFRTMFLLVGGILAFIVGLVGVLNFVNAILTGILTRKREFAVLQSIGMTGRQLGTMLVCEGLLYALGSVVLAAVLALAAGPLAALVLEKMFWFFSYKPTFVPLLVVAPVFALLGWLVPKAVYRSVSRYTLVERLRQSEP